MLTRTRNYTQEDGWEGPGRGRFTAARMLGSQVFGMRQKNPLVTPFEPPSTTGSEIAVLPAVALNSGTFCFLLFSFPAIRSVLLGG